MIQVRINTRGATQHRKRCHNFRRLMSPSSEVTALLRLTLSTKLVKLCGVSFFVLSVVVRASPRMFFRFDLSSSNADIDFVLLKLKHRINSSLPNVMNSYSLRVTRIDGEHMVLVQRRESLVLDVDIEIIL
jgi:hypothetical protein